MDIEPTSSLRGLALVRTVRCKWGLHHYPFNPRNCLQFCCRRHPLQLMSLRHSPFLTLLLHAKNYLTASVATKALGFISLPVLTRLLSPGGYGIFSVFLSYLGLPTIILSLNSYTSVGRYWYEKKADCNRFLVPLYSWWA